MLAINSPVKYGFAPNILKILQKRDLIHLFASKWPHTSWKCILFFTHPASCICGTNVGQIWCVIALGSRWCHIPALSIRWKLKPRALKIGWLRLTFFRQKKNFSLLISPKPLEDISFTFPETWNGFSLNQAPKATKPLGNLGMGYASPVQSTVLGRSMRPFSGI